MLEVNTLSGTMPNEKSEKLTEIWSTWQHLRGARKKSMKTRSNNLKSKRRIRRNSVKETETQEVKSGVKNKQKKASKVKVLGFH